MPQIAGTETPNLAVSAATGGLDGSCRLGTTFLLVRCPECHEEIDIRGPGVAEYEVTVDLGGTEKLGDTTWAWVPFIEDWRGGLVTMIHPRCFAEAHDVDKLVEIIHKREILNRGNVPTLMRQIRDLKSKLRSVADNGE